VDNRGGCHRSSSRRQLPFLRTPRRRLSALAGGLAAVVVVVLTGRLLFTQAKHSPTAALSTSSATPSQAETPAPCQMPTSSPTFGGFSLPYPASVPAGKTKVLWMVGLGPGEQPDQLQAERNFVDRYNATNNDNICLQLTIVNPGGNATDTLSSEIDAGNGPDILGPLEIESMVGFSGVWLGLNDEIAKNKTDLSAYPPALLSPRNSSAIHRHSPILTHILTHEVPHETILPFVCNHHRHVRLYRTGPAGPGRGALQSTEDGQSRRRWRLP